MRKIIGFVLVLAGVAIPAAAGAVPVAPEIDPASGAAALGLLAGGLLVLRGRRK